MNGTGAPAEGKRKLGVTELTLAGTILVSATCVGLAMALYVLPGEGLPSSSYEPGVRVDLVEDLPIGSGRVVGWGERIILVVRSSEDGYAALEGTSPLDGCILEWDAQASRIVSPCRYLVYDLHGNVVAGLTTAPLRRYRAFVRGGVVYVGEGGGG